MKGLPSRAHFIGIGGSGMGPLAEALLRVGVEITGSDICEGPMVRRLRRLGARISVSHNKSNLDEARLVVFSSAIPADNPEIEEAKRRGIEVIHRAEMLARLMRGCCRRGILVAGTHGKTTGSALVAFLLKEAGLKPWAIVGGTPRGSLPNPMIGEGDFFVTEADESDGSMLILPAFGVIVTNIEADHLDHFGDIEEIYRAFLGLAEKIPEDGILVLNADDPRCRRLASERLKCRVATFGLVRPADYQAKWVRTGPSGSRFVVCKWGREVGEARLSIPGRHNVENVLGALALCDGLGLDIEGLLPALPKFKGMRRRFEPVVVGPVTVIDDYGHHPTEIQAVLLCARQLVKGGRIFVVFQPHRFSRTKFLAAEFPPAFSLADVVIVTEIYGAFEEPIPGVTGAWLAEHIARGTPKCVEVEYAPTIEEAVEKVLAKGPSEGEVILTVGAGDVYKVAHLLRRRLKGGLQE